MIIVLDIGKTNKKVLLFSNDLKIVDIRKKNFNEVEQKDGIRIEQTEAVEEWFFQQITDFAKHNTIDAISITTHSTNVVCLDKDDKLSIPTIAYTNEAGEDIDKLYFERFGSFEELQKETATAAIGSMINTARILHFAKIKYPENFANTTKILFYPQYFGYKLTGTLSIESTSLGSHTFLYDPQHESYSRVARELGISELLPPHLSRPWDVIGRVTKQVSERTGISTNCIVTAGIHDSNSSLLPYLINNETNFVLNSTGTWCVIMRPTDKIEFTKDDLGRTIYYNIDAYNNPVKTIIFMGGVEFERYNNILEKHFKNTGMPEFNQDIYKEVLKKSSFLFIPSVIKGVGIFPDSQPKVIKEGESYTLKEIEENKSIRDKIFTDRNEAYAALNASLVAQTIVALGYTGFNGGGSLFIEGGFRNNDAYTQLLAEYYTGTEVVTTNLKEATSVGAALLARAALDKVDPKELDSSICKIDKQKISPTNIGGINEYTTVFINSITKN